MKKSKTILIVILCFFSIKGYSQNKNEIQAEIYYEKAVKSIENNALKEATVNIDKAIYLDPKNSNSYYIKGVIKQKQLDYNGALILYKKAIQFNPKNSEAMTKCGIIYGKLNDMANSCKYFNLGCENGNEDACKIYNKFCY